jgi:hypothetical protein
MTSAACTVCNHPQRAEIERLLAACRRRADDGEARKSAGTLRAPSIKRIAKRYGVGRMALQRHWRNHVPAEQRASLIAGPTTDLVTAAVFASERGASLYDQIEKSAERLLVASFAALAAGREHGASILYGRFLESVRLLAQLSGDLRRGSTTVTTNIAVFESPVMTDLKLGLIEWLDPFPEARGAVFEGLEALARRWMQPAPPVLEVAKVANG